MNQGIYTYGEPLVYWDGTSEEKANIGKFCSIAAGVTLFLGGQHHTDWVSTYPLRIMMDLEGKNKDGHPFGKGDIHIGNDVWIGRGASIMSGVKIGNGAVIAANAHVVKDVEPYSIVGGNPAKHLKFRFNPNQIQHLESIAWWNWEIPKIQKNVHLINGATIDEFIEKFK
ncbi:MAG: CatB-related O-acetyltransferase [Chitinophagales bacterium]|nr:CatB-related O-acetyltransferase [Chitinophagales bacterium]